MFYWTLTAVTVIHEVLNDCRKDLTFYQGMFKPPQLKQKTSLNPDPRASDHIPASTNVRAAFTVSS